MKKFNIISLIFFATTLLGMTEAKAQVSGMPEGYILEMPTVSTAEAPVWYNMMASNPVAERANRYLSYDGTSLNTVQFNAGIGEADQADKYIWRLEAGPSGEGYVILVNKETGKQLFTPAEAIVGAQVTAGDAGIEWKIAPTTSFTSVTGTVAGQNYFNFEGGATARYLNAADALTFNWGVIVFGTDGSISKSSGWFFYPVALGNGIHSVTQKNTQMVISISDQLVLSSNLKEPKTIEIFNLQGQKVLGATRHFSQINTSELSAGGYIVKISTSAAVYTQKVLKK